MTDKRRGPTPKKTGRRIAYRKPRALTPLQRMVLTLREKEPTPTYEEIGKECVLLGLATSSERRFIEGVYRRAATKAELLREYGVSEDVIYGRG